MIQFDYTVTTSKLFDEAVKDIEEKIEEKGFKVLKVHDVAETLKNKGFERDPYKIIEFCNAGYASRVLEADSKIGLCLPCKINVYKEKNKIMISAVLPTVISEFFPDSNLGEIPEEIEEKVRNIVDEAK